MRTFDNYLEAFEFSKENPDTLVRYASGIVNCYLYNGIYHGEYIRYNINGTVQYRDFSINGIRIIVNGLSEIQLQNIFGECYENI